MRERSPRTNKFRWAGNPFRKRPSRSDGSDGFTLLEVMIAVAVMAVGVVPLLVVHGSTVGNLRRSREMTQSVLLARSRMAMLETLGFDALENEDTSDPAALLADENNETPAYLTVEEAVEEVEPLLLIQADIGVVPKFVAAAKEDKRAGVKVVTDIPSLYFEPPEEEATGEE